MSNLPKVRLATTHGDIVLELNADAAPDTVANFLDYIAADFYRDTVFHRVIDGFMIQGGGLDAELRQKATRAPIRNEANNGLANEIGTIAMARTGEPHSATAQFFINVANNAFLNHRDPSVQGWGYCVFGRVVDGMATVDAIRTMKTGVRRGMQDVPVETVSITGTEVLPPG
jgi:peptidyl-prolyl cis-trans isomerase B (cyclophilin B)